MTDMIYPGEELYLKIVLYAGYPPDTPASVKEYSYFEGAFREAMQLFHRVSPFKKLESPRKRWNDWYENVRHAIKLSHPEATEQDLCDITLKYADWCRRMKAARRCTERRKDRDRVQRANPV